MTFVPYYLCMRALELVILSRHLNLHKSLFCHFGDPTQEFVLSLWWPYTRVVLSSPARWIAGPVIGPDLRGQLSVQIYGASYRSRSTGPVIGPDLQGQWSVHFFRASYRSISSGPVIGLFLQGQLSVQPYQLRYWSVYFTNFKIMQVDREDNYESNELLFYI